VHAVRGREPDRPAVEQNAFPALEPLAELGPAPVDADSAGGDPALDLTSRADACVRQKLLNALRQFSTQ
jgi:hypothetical protein